MVYQRPFLLETLAQVDNDTFLFQQHFKMAFDLLPPPAHACLLPFEQLIKQQMVQLQDSISKRLHYHTLSNMFPNGTYEAHHARILSCSGPWIIFPTFQLFSPFFGTTFNTWFGLPHPSIVSIPWCVCTHPIDTLGIHLLHYVHGNEHTWTHDVTRDTFVAIVQDAGFHVGWKQLHALPSTTFNSSRRRVDIVLTKNDIISLTNVVIVDPTRVDLLPQLKDLLLQMQLKPMKGAIATNTLVINSSP